QLPMGAYGVSVVAKYSPIPVQLPGRRPEGMDYTHAHVEAREGHPIPEVPGRSRARTRVGRGAPVRPGGSSRAQSALREPRDPDPATIAAGPLGLPVQRRRAGRGGRPRPGERGRAEPAPTLPSRLNAA